MQCRLDEQWENIMTCWPASNRLGRSSWIMGLKYVYPTIRLMGHVRQPASSRKQQQLAPNFQKKEFPTGLLQPPRKVSRP